MIVPLSDNGCKFRSQHTRTLGNGVTSVADLGETAAAADPQERTKPRPLINKRTNDGVQKVYSPIVQLLPSNESTEPFAAVTSQFVTPAAHASAVCAVHEQHQLHVH
jgi:hypothetical protein